MESPKTETDSSEDTPIEKHIEIDTIEVNFDEENSSNRLNYDQVHNKDDLEKIYNEKKKLADILLENFFGFLNQDGKQPGGRLNPVLSGYFTKIFESFVNQKPDNIYKIIFEEQPEIIENFKKHFYLRSIAEAFIKIVTFQSEEIGDIKYKD